MTTRTEATEISVGMKNSLRALLGLQRSTEEQDRYFHAADIYAQRHNLPYTWSNPMWERKDPPANVQETQEFLERAHDEGYLERAIIGITGMSENYKGFRTKEDKMSEIENLVRGND
ncbi:MAG: hypothetical protein AABX26_01305 [Nanoarchaeota archaeon]